MQSWEWLCCCYYTRVVLTRLKSIKVLWLVCQVHFTRLSGQSRKDSGFSELAWGKRWRKWNGGEGQALYFGRSGTKAKYWRKYFRVISLCQFTAILMLWNDEKWWTYRIRETAKHFGLTSLWHGRWHWPLWGIFCVTDNMLHLLYGLLLFIVLKKEHNSLRKLSNLPKFWTAKKQRGWCLGEPVCWG